MILGSAVVGCGLAVPDARRTNADLVDYLDTTDEWIQQRTGISSRRICAPNEATSDLAAEACRLALKDASMSPADLDMVIVATFTPDHLLPGTAPLVHSMLGARSAGSFDINAGCAGFVTALSVADAMVRAGTVRAVAVCGADVVSRFVDPEDRTTAILFGDGAGAVIVVASDEPRLGPFVFGTDGERLDCLMVPAGGSRMPATHKTITGRLHNVTMKGQDVYRHAVDRMEQAVREVLDGEDVNSVDLLVAHQANARIVSALAERIGLDPGRAVCNIAEYGNTSAASIPIALAESVEQGQLNQGSRVLTVAFGAGFAWAAGLITWGQP